MVCPYVSALARFSSNSNMTPYGEKDSSLYRKAAKEANRILGLIGSTEKHGDMGIGGYCRLLDAIRRTGLDTRYDIGAVSERVRELVKGSIVRDTSKWVFYGVRPITSQARTAFTMRTTGISSRRSLII
jgi:hypothetical protein